MVKLQDQRDYYILEDPNGVKHFIEAETYTSYGIEIGKELKCQVAKINCTGRILLEPIHPIYIEGLTYDFNVISLNDIETKYVMVIEDIFRNKIELNLTKSFFSAFGQDNFVKCRVIKLKKGIPEVEILY